MVELKDELFTVAEAANLLKVTRHTVYRWIAEGRLPAVKYSRRVVRVRRRDLEPHHEVGLQTAVREPSVKYEPGPSVLSHEDEREEVRRLLERYRKLSARRRGSNEPPKGSPEALLRHVGVISAEEGEELRRIIREDREASRNDSVFSFDDPA